MLIINADDFGINQFTTDRTLSSYKCDRITSVSAMMYMSDTKRSSEMALEYNIESGLHLNFTEQFSGNNIPPLLKEYHENISRFLLKNKYFHILYNPMLRKQFFYVYKIQFDEYVRLYNRMPTHINGHHHMHLCGNIIFSRIIPKGTRVRKHFSFLSKQKNLFNLYYRKMSDFFINKRYICTDYFFSLLPVEPTDRLHKIIQYAKFSYVEIMTHPGNTKEFAYLMSDEYKILIDRVKKGTFLDLKSS
jgi:predicted glycoside hydrolase/deacetylase ChbG (UPF0249 family)